MVIWIIVSATVWLIGACCFETHAWYIKKHQRWRWALRQDGLISFTNRQFMIMRWLWPLVPIGFVLTMLFIGTLSLLAMIARPFRK